MSCPDCAIRASDAQKTSIIPHGLHCGIKEWRGSSVGIKIDDIVFVGPTWASGLVPVGQIVRDSMVHERKCIALGDGDFVLKQRIKDAKRRLVFLLGLRSISFVGLSNFLGCLRLLLWWVCGILGGLLDIIAALSLLTLLLHP
ncbi:hypothetical protein HG530_010097 [Fusarium avenaceum]|nr:hypothetical protein HG530_010097 [Fusarium avenaceum]